MKICNSCGKEFPNWVIINGIKRNLKSRKFCLECSPFGIHPAAQKKVTERYGECKCCGKPLPAKGRIYCSNKCQHENEYKAFITAWKEAGASGTTGVSWIGVSRHIKRYLFEKFGSKCARCGWAEENPYTHTTPLEVEHIDGNAENNSEENLTLLCPNCHSLTKTYRGANKGNGKRNIKWLSRSGTTNATGK